MKLQTKLLMGFISALTLGQILWWAYLIIHQQELIAGFVQTPEMDLKAQNYRWMILAEGGFFLSVCFVGFILIFRAIRREWALKSAQSDFLSAVTHELKTPLANIRLCLDTLERPNLSSDQVSKYIRRAQQSVDKLVEEVETVLALAHQGRFDVTAESFDVNDLIEDCLNAIPDDSLRSNIHFARTSPLMAYSPYRESRLILRNLIDNALKFSKGTSPRIEVLVGREGSSVFASVVDNGIGLKRDDAAKVFEPFYRAEEGRKIDPTGTGLGLTLVRRLCLIAKAEVSVESDGLNCGTRAKVAWTAEGANV